MAAIGGTAVPPLAGPPGPGGGFYAPPPGPGGPYAYPQPPAGMPPVVPVTGPQVQPIPAAFDDELLEIADEVVDRRDSPQMVPTRFQWTCQKLRDEQDRSNKDDKISRLSDDDLAALVASVVVTQELTALARRGFFDRYSIPKGIQAAGPTMFAILQAIGNVGLLGDLTPGHYSPRAQQAAERAVTAALPKGFGKLAAKWKKHRERLAKKPKVKHSKTFLAVLVMLIVAGITEFSCVAYFRSDVPAVVFGLLLVIALVWLVDCRVRKPRRSIIGPWIMVVIVCFSALIAGIATGGGVKEQGISSAETQRIKNLSPATTGDLNGVTRDESNQLDAVIDADMRYCSPSVRKTDPMCDVVVPLNNGTPNPQKGGAGNLFVIQCEVDKKVTAVDHKTNGVPTWCPK